jgi:tRNA A58 N-methylase Trm61
MHMEIDFEYQARFYLGIFERELVPWYRRFCTAGSLSFDVGAREGYVTLVLARLSAPDGRVAAFEFNETEYHRLLRNIAANPDLRPAPQAVLARVTGRSVGAQLTLDDAAYERYFVPDVVKLDIEGSELKALQGAERLLTERRPHLVVETHSADLEHACAELLARHGYEPRVVQPRGWFPEVREAHNRWLVATGQAR